MSPKTNPLSLQSQNAGIYEYKKGEIIIFLHLWFTGAFFSDTFQYESSIRKYIDRLWKVTRYSKAFFSTKNF